jgi:hypothetical protein
MNTGVGKVGMKKAVKVRFGKKGLKNIPPDLPPFNNESRNSRYAPRFIPADIPVHQTDGIPGFSVFIIVDSLNQRTGAIPDASHRYFDLSHNTYPPPHQQKGSIYNKNPINHLSYSTITNRK